MDKWQPIETAPKRHAVSIIAFEPSCTMALVTWLDAKHVMDGEEDGFVTGWYVSDGHNDPIWYRGHLYLTHWMPLPAPPEESENG